MIIIELLLKKRGAIKQKKRAEDCRIMSKKRGKSEKNRGKRGEKEGRRKMFHVKHKKVSVFLKLILFILKEDTNLFKKMFRIF